MVQIDVTEKVRFGTPNDTYLPLTKCVCGAEFSIWSFNLSMYSDALKSCPHCGREFYFRVAVRVFQVEE